MENVQRNITPLTVGSLMSERALSYSVSFFQRDYSWGRDQRQKFFDDLERLGEKDKHFFGHMIFSEAESPNEYNIIDGQQRLITVTIMAAVIRDILSEKGDPKFNEIHKKYVKARDGKDEYYGFKLRLSDSCSVFFRDYIQTPGTPVQKIAQMKTGGNYIQSLRLIRDCYIDFYTLLKNRASGNLKKIWRKLNQGFWVIPVYMHSLGFAATYFETLNDRGMPLTLSDKMKCKLLGITDPQWKEAKLSWDNIAELPGLDGKNLDAFLQHYWLSTQGQTTKKRLFEEYCNKKITDRREAFELLRDLSVESRTYSMLLCPDLKNFNGDKETLDSIKELHILSKMQVMPLLTAAFPRLDRTEFHRLLRHTTNLIFRYLTIESGQNKILEAMFSKIAREIRKNEHSRKAAFVLDEFKTIFPSDDKFREDFAKKAIAKETVAVYVLKQIEMEKQRKDGRPNIEFSPKMTLEHILPKNPDEDCEKFMKTNGTWNIRGELTNRLGNLTLLLRKDNEKADNQSPLIKSKEIYSKQTFLKINEDLANLNSWDSTDIDNRQREFANLAVSIWTLPN